MGSRESLVTAAFAAAALLAACAPAKRAEPTVAPKPAAPVAAAPAPVPAPPPPAAMPSGTLIKVSGTVVSVDASAHTVTIKDYHGKTRVFRVAGAAKITKGGAEKAVDLSSLAAGDRVHLKTGGDVAASVHVMVVASK